MRAGLLLSFAIVALLGAVGAATAEETKLTGPEIQAALADKTALYSGGEIKQYFAKNGQTPYWDGSRLTHGTWRVAGDRYCSVWPPSAAQSCYAVYRKDSGEIVWVGERNDRYVAEMHDGNQM